MEKTDTITVEFMGPPGAGKTTLQRSVARTLPRTIAGTAGRNECLSKEIRIGPIISLLPDQISDGIYYRIWEYLFQNRLFYEFVGDHPDVLKYVNVVAHAWPDPARFVGLFVRKVATYQLFRSHSQRYDHIFIDDGLFQSLAMSTSLDTETIAHVVDTIPLPDLLVIADLPAETCVRRQQSRSRGFASFYDNMSSDEILSQISDCRTQINDIGNIVRKKGLPVVEIDGSKSVHDSKEKIIQVMRRGF